LSSFDLSKELQNLPEWQITQGKNLGREFRFKSFREAFAFMTEIAFHAEKLNHHPDWSNSYNKVFVELFTHDKQAITALDIQLATEINKIYAQRKS